MAAKWADSAGIYHGSVVGMAWIALEALGPIPGASYSTDVLTDSVIVIAIDLATLIAGALGGWLGRRDPWSSSDKDRGR